MSVERFQIRAVVKSDLPTLITIFNSAFAGDPVIMHLFPNTPSDVLEAYQLRVWNQDFEGIAGRNRWWAVVDAETDSNEIVAFSKWWFPHPATAEEETPTQEKPSRPPGSNVELSDEFTKKLKDARKRWVTNDMYFVNVLVVSPSNQRQGLGNLLLNQGLEFADHDGSRAFIEASKKGVGLYRKLGWVKVDEIEVDMKPHGGEGIEKMELMMREPRHVGTIQSEDFV